MFYKIAEVETTDHMTVEGARLPGTVGQLMAGRSAFFSRSWGLGICHFCSCVTVVYRSIVLLHLTVKHTCQRNISYTNMNMVQILQNKNFPAFSHSDPRWKEKWCVLNYPHGIKGWCRWGKWCDRGAVNWHLDHCSCWFPGTIPSKSRLFI